MSILFNISIIISHQHVCFVLWSFEESCFISLYAYTFDLPMILASGFAPVFFNPFSDIRTRAQPASANLLELAMVIVPVNIVNHCAIYIIYEINIRIHNPGSDYSFSKLFQHV